MEKKNLYKLCCDGKDKLCKARKVDIKLRDLKMIVRGTY